MKVDTRQKAINEYNKRMDELKKGVCDGTRAASELVPIILKTLVTNKPVCKNMLHKIFLKGDTKSYDAIKDEVTEEMYGESPPFAVNLADYGIDSKYNGEVFPIHEAVLSKNPTMVQALINAYAGRQNAVNNIDRPIIVAVTKQARGKNVVYGKTARGLVDLMIIEEKNAKALRNLKIIKCLLIKAGAKPKYANSTLKTVSASNKKLVNNTRNANYNCSQVAGRRNEVIRSTRKHRN